MSDQPNLPVGPAPAEPIVQKWVRALTRPSELTYAEMAASPEAKASTGYLWYFIGSLVVTLLGAAVQQPLLRNMMSQSGIQNVDLGSPLAYLLCGAPIGAVISTLFFAIGTAIVQWIASLFGGRGTNNQLVYVFSNILTPYLFVTGVLTLLAAIPFVGLCFGLLSLAAGLYVLVLEIMAVKGVNRIDWGPAIAAVLIPGLVVAFVCACLIAGVFALVYPAIRQSIPQLQQVIPQY